MKRYFAILTAVVLSAGTCFSDERPADYSLRVGALPLVVRANLEGTPVRSIAVGYPGGFSYCFDSVRARPVYCWSGRFIDMKREITGRGGYTCRVLGIRRDLGIDKMPWSVGQPGTPPESILFRGYRRPSDGPPVFLCRIDGTDIEQFITETSDGTIAYQLHLARGRSKDFFLSLDPTQHQSVDLSEGLKWESETRIRIPAAVASGTITIKLAPSDAVFEDKEVALSGKELVATYCNACHSTDGTKLIGPSFKGIWGAEHSVLRKDVTATARVDANYIRRSILAPQEEVLQGFEKVMMPSYKGVLGDAEINRIIGYLKSLAASQ